MTTKDLGSFFWGVKAQLGQAVVRRQGDVARRRPKNCQHMARILSKRWAEQWQTERWQKDKPNIDRPSTDENGNGQNIERPNADKKRKKK